MTSIELRFTFKGGFQNTEQITPDNSKHAEFYFPSRGWMSVEHSQDPADLALIREAAINADIFKAKAYPLNPGESLEVQTGEGKMIIAHLPE